MGYIGVKKKTLILTIDPNFLGHPSKKLHLFRGEQKSYLYIFS